MADLRRTMQTAGRLEHAGQVVVPAWVLAQRRAERAERRRRAAATIIGIAGDADLAAG